METFDNVLIKMVKGKPLLSEEPIKEPQDAVILLSKLLEDTDREMVFVINLDNKNKPINYNLMSIGSVNYCMVEPREVFKSSILSNATSILLLHNHPSNDLTPSNADLEITERIEKAGDILGIPLLDHVIVGTDNYLSIKGEKGE